MFFVSVASKGLSVSISDLESTLCRGRVSVASKGVAAADNALRGVTAGYGQSESQKRN